MGYTLPFGIPARGSTRKARISTTTATSTPSSSTILRRAFPAGAGRRRSPAATRDWTRRRSTRAARSIRQTRPTRPATSIPTATAAAWNGRGPTGTTTAQHACRRDRRGRRGRSPKVLGYGVARRPAPRSSPGTTIGASCSSSPIVLNGIVQELAKNEEGEMPVAGDAGSDPETREAIEASSDESSSGHQDRPTRPGEAGQVLT